MTLKELITLLKLADRSLIVHNGFSHGHAHRGYYEQLAFDREEVTTIGEMIDHAEYCIDVIFQGYKGGEYKMTEDTPCHLADYGCCGEEITVSMVLNWIKIY